MNTQFKKGIVEMCILSIIKKRDMYGYEVIEKLATDIDVNENTVYPILRRLTSQGLFDTYMEQTNIGAPRKYYQITALGKEKLDEYEGEWTAFLKGVFKLLGGLKDES
ncbi:MAG: PadR family transcriptional regulator [Firmicutes bacterium]|nr:PadR family transcriptional regulator [Bacillota bacterium]